MFLLEGFLHKVVSPEQETGQLSVPEVFRLFDFCEYVKSLSSRFPEFSVLLKEFHSMYP